MFGQTRSFEMDELQETVDRYAEESRLYESFVPPRLNVRKYLQYIEENNISDPSTIPEEVIDSFMRKEKPQKAVV